MPCAVGGRTRADVFSRAATILVALVLPACVAGSGWQRRNQRALLHVRIPGGVAQAVVPQRKCSLVEGHEGCGKKST